MLKTGIRGEQSVEVVYENTATAVGSGVLKVFATPCMLALMEKTACDSVIPYLDEGNGTVGTQVDIRHLAATPIGMTVRCESELLEVDGRRLVFDVKAYDDAGLIGEGTHERFIVNNEKFQSKADAKLHVTP
ncbi:MAG: thioesterase family protein [Clostridiales bacterium]|nr:thioesterase family protein [Clostridiales bacterium]